MCSYSHSLKRYYPREFLKVVISRGPLVYQAVMVKINLCFSNNENIMLKVKSKNISECTVKSKVSFKK